MITHNKGFGEIHFARQLSSKLLDAQIYDGHISLVEKGVDRPEFSYNTSREDSARPRS